jgi:hypothetical protein
MRGSGVSFEAYELPNLDSDAVESRGHRHRTAWFRDSEGNILKIEERRGPRERAAPAGP